MILIFEGIDLLLGPSLLDRLLDLHDLHQRRLVRQAAMRVIVLGGDVDAVIVMQEIACAQQRVRERLVGGVEQRRQRQDRLLMRRRAGRILVRVVLALQLEEFALQRAQRDAEGARGWRARGERAWEERVVVRYVWERSRVLCRAGLGVAVAVGGGIGIGRGC